MFKVHSSLSGRQGGVIGIMTALLLPVLIGFLALALETARLYNRQEEMRSLAQAVAISAAGQLNGTSDGISKAIANAKDLLASGAGDTKKLHYQYESTINFSESAIKFANSPDGAAGWLDANSAKASPAGLAYVRVATNDLDEDYGTVDLYLIQVLSDTKALNMAYTAVAGKRRLKLTPLAICEMSKDPSQPFQERKYSSGISELTEYGFRRGVSYNLMNLSPNSSTPVNYLVDPISVFPKAGNFSIGTVGPYLCTGTVELPRVIGEQLNLQSPFQISQFSAHLNSRFNKFNSTTKECNAMSAPPDSNTRSFAAGSGNIDWMTDPGTAHPVADTATPITDRLETIADLDPSKSPALAASYGPLWVFARAVPWSSYTAGQPEPPGGYTPFQATSNIWKSLYSPGPSLATYPSSTNNATPYSSTQAAGIPSTNYPGQIYRRVLNVPLLRCPVGGSAGKVVAIARFFMTGQATTSAINAEFAGVTLQEEISGPVELYR
jgi:Flp pilus assembly protein TadG